MNKRLSTTQKIAFCGMLIVLDIIGTRVIRTPILANFSFIRMSLGPALVIYSSLLLGPFYGAVVGAGGDLIGILIFTGIEGQINPLITIVYGLLGILPYYLDKLLVKQRSFFKKPYILFGGLLLLLVVQVLLFYVIPSTRAYFISGFGETYLWAFPLIVSLTAFFDILAMVGLYYTNRHFLKHSEECSDIPSPNEVGLICLIVEVLLMVLLKPLAFYVFYNWMAASPFPISYSVLFSCMLVFASLNVVLNTFVVSWLLVWSRRFMNNFGFESENNHGK